MKRPFGLHRTVLLLAGTHFIVDGYGNILAPLLPLLITRLGLSLAAAGTLQMCFQLANSVSQLGFGHIADRWRPRLLLLSGPLICVSVLPLVGRAPGAVGLAMVLILGGLGGAAFHPPAAALVHRYSGNQRGLAMSFHITSGGLGQAVAPLLFAPFVQAYGLRATPILIAPAVAVLLLVFLRRIPAIERLQDSHQAGGIRALRPYAKPLTLLYLIVVLRTLTSMSFSTFVPILLTQRGMTLAQAGTAASVYLFAVGLGGFFGGPTADRFGPRRVIIVSLVSAVPLLALAPQFTGWMFVVILAIGGFLLQSTLPVNVTFGQTIAPISAATVSSLMMGFAWGMGGLSVPFVGMLADRIGIDHTLTAMAAVPLVAAALALPLPAGKGVPRSVSADIVTPEHVRMDIAD
ncbi:MAG TPA: MFS transporter [Vicinamibacterales bacterium]|jgi:FSR family fosmidomycin resistance protein-like MFS transporter